MTELRGGPWKWEGYKNQRPQKKRKRKEKEKGKKKKGIGDEVGQIKGKSTFMKLENDENTASDTLSMDCLGDLRKKSTLDNLIILESEFNYKIKTKEK